MTVTIKNSPELNSPGKPGAPSRNSENKAGQFPRSNPVCLEVSVTIRGMPAEAGGLTQPIEEDGRTVIVFDNGAVLRSTQNLPVGHTVTLSNTKGRDVVCRVVGGRNLPSVKGYVEVEFVEPVNDFWGIHQDIGPVAAVATPPAAPLAPREAAVPPLPAPTHAAARFEAPGKPASASLGRGLSFEDIAGLMKVPAPAAPRESKTEPAKPGPEIKIKSASGYDLSEGARSTSLANWISPGPELATEKRAIPAAREASPITSPTPSPSRELMSKGLMADEQPDSTPSASNGRMPLVVGMAALILAGVCAVVFFMHRGTAPVPVAKSDVVSQSSKPEPPAPSSAPEPVQAPQEEAAQVATQPQTQAQPDAVDQAQPVAAVAPVPAVVTSPAITDSQPESQPGSRNVQRQEKNTVVAKQPDLSSSRRPVIPNLKMGSPNAPNQKLAGLGEGTAPITDIASTEAVGGSPPAGLLTSAGRTSNPPAPPPSAPAPVSAAKTARDAKLISSTRLVYPAAARQSNIQGSVTVYANIDENGNVVGAKALSGPMLLRQAAEGSVRQWKYSPALIDGKSAPSQVTVSVEFRLN